MRSLMYALLLACVVSSVALAEPASAPASQEVIEFSGTVVRVNLEGGFWGLIGPEGRQYDPGPLAPAFRRDGLRVRVRAKVLRGAVTFRMWGIRIEILDIEALPTATPAPSAAPSSPSR